MFLSRCIKMKFNQLNAELQSMLTTSIDFPQHKRILRMKDNWENVFSLSTIYRTYQVSENLRKLKTIRQIHSELIKCARIINEAYGFLILMSTSLSVIRDFMYQLVQNRLTFTACGFYDLDYTFIYNAIGLITTYLVILIQVEGKPNIVSKNTIKPLVIINSILTTGLVEYSIDNKINTIGMVYACFLIILYVTVGNLFSFPMEDYSMKPQIMQITHQLHTYSCYVFFLVTIVAGILRRKKLRHLTLQIETCIRNMDQLNIPMDFSKYFWQQCYAILFSVCILIAMPIIDHRWCIKTKFRQLNELLKKMLTTTVDSPQHKRIHRMLNNRKNDSTSFDICQTEIHLQLIKCARNTSHAYSLHIFMSVSTALFFIITVAYNVKSCMRRNYNGDILCELYEPSTSNEFRTEIRGFIVQLIQNPLIFTFYGFFDLNYILIRNIIGAVISYLVILIQIGKVSA
ncbi:uncharacterized protein LOC122627280 [Vespula pensylvanica]|uniref:uncharacterized protein LOC122627280 n=1 Tax=Vespula pensylvanica TaxID=30213 RepID=UPI001CBA2EB5|nr:uncharacterized protein LOC122627280 [Vespula pensylvanica]